MNTVSKQNTTKHNNAVGGTVGRTDHYRTHLVVSEIWPATKTNMGAVKFAVIRGVRTKDENASLKGYMTAVRCEDGYQIRMIESWTLHDDAFYEHSKTPFSDCMLDLLSVERLDAILRAGAKKALAA